VIAILLLNEGIKKALALNPLMSILVCAESFTSDPSMVPCEIQRLSIPSSRETHFEPSSDTIN